LLSTLLQKRGTTIDALRDQIEKVVRYANIIEGHDASQYGIGIVSARIAEIVLNDEHAVNTIRSLKRRNLEGCIAASTFSSQATIKSNLSF
jgi:L-lactate dehydrogenase